MSTTPLPLMLFAAGFGTRMGALTKDRPKPLVHVAGQPLIDHALALSGPQGTRRIVANAHYRAEMIQDHLANRPDITVLHEYPEVLETAGGLRNALPSLGTGPVITLNSDAVWAGPNPLSALEAAFQPAQMDALLLLVPPTNALGHAGAGDFTMASDGRLTRGPGHIYTGAQVIDPAILEGLPEGPVSLNAAWDIALQRKRLFGLIYQGRWVDVGQPTSIALAEDLLRTAGAASD